MRDSRKDPFNNPHVGVCVCGCVWVCVGVCGCVGVFEGIPVAWFLKGKRGKPPFWGVLRKEYQCWRIDQGGTQHPGSHGACYNIYQNKRASEQKAEAVTNQLQVNKRVRSVSRRSVHSSSPDSEHFGNTLFGWLVLKTKRRHKGTKGSGVTFTGHVRSFAPANSIPTNSIQLTSTQFKPNQLHSTRLNLTQLDSNQHISTRIKSAQLVLTQLNSTNPTLLNSSQLNANQEVSSTRLR